MMHTNKYPLLLGLILSLSNVIYADDAVEAIGTNDIVFEKPAGLVMLDETLTISKLNKKFLEQNYKIDVDFHFKNETQDTITRKIAFVLPPVRCDMGNHSNWQGLSNATTVPDYAKGLTDFTLTVDGKTLTFTKRSVAYLGKQDITALLKKLHVPLNPCQIKMNNDGKLEAPYQALLEKQHLLTKENLPQWTENIYFEWEQSFPPQKIINIHHRYTPIIGTSVASPRTLADVNAWFSDTQLHPLWNRNPATLKESHPHIIYKPKNTSLEDKNVETRYCLIPALIRYHLTTGSFWNGGIGTFNLIIKDENGGPFAVNEFYTKANAVQTTIMGNSMKFTTYHFIPTKDLLVMFLSLPTSVSDLQECGIG